MATTKPASGPAIPMSNISRRLAFIPSIPITAPIVPIGLIGSGMKNGKLAGIRYRNVARKCPISCVNRINNTQPV
ncbi:MAG: hypothetical protein H8E66_26450 [Planctomycetes bacterium]|nr:hypothetical protein [Planctomycetota bacterium]